jgi:hypothetical protein
VRSPHHSISQPNLPVFSNVSGDSFKSAPLALEHFAKLTTDPHVHKLTEIQSVNEEIANQEAQQRQAIKKIIKSKFFFKSVSPPKASSFKIPPAFKIPTAQEENKRKLT